MGNLHKCRVAVPAAVFDRSIAEAKVQQATAELELVVEEAVNYSQLAATIPKTYGKDWDEVRAKAKKAKGLLFQAQFNETKALAKRRLTYSLHLLKGGEDE